jgi:branched-chain amino acid transport system substrate-binding protein
MATTAWTAALAASALALAAGGVWAQEEEPIKVGIVTTLSGAPAALGEQLVRGFQLAVEEMGGEMGGRPVEVVIRDDELQPEVAQLAARELVEREEVDFVVGTTFSNMLQAIFKPVTDAEVFLLSPNAGPSTFAGRNCHPFFFATSYQNDQNHEVMGRVATEAGYGRVVLLAPNYQAGRDSFAGVKKSYEGEVVEEIFVPLESQDFSAELARIAEARPDALFAFMPGGLGVRLVGQFRQAGLADQMAFLSAFTTDETTLPAQGEAALGFLTGSSWAPDLDNEANRAFVDAYIEAHDAVPGSYAAHAYDTARLIRSAVGAVEGDLSDKEALREALKAAEFDSVRGDFAFGDNQFPVQDFHLLEVVEREDGRIATAFERTVFEDYQDSYAAECDME